MTKEQAIKDYMVKLDISKEEAEQLWLDDQKDYIGEEGEAMTQKAKSVKNYVQAKERKQVKKERKVDTAKLELLNLVAAALKQEMDIDCTFENEVALHFQNEGQDYTFKLTRHKKKKGDN